MDVVNVGANESIGAELIHSESYAGESTVVTIVSPKQHRVQEQFRSHDLADVLLALNRAYLSWSQGTLEHDLSFVKAAEPGSRIFLWTAAETVRLAVAWCRQPAFDRVGEDARQTREQYLMPLIEDATDLLSSDRLVGTKAAEQLVADGDLRDSMLRILEPQHLLQRQSPCRNAQPILMYREAARRRAQRDPKFDLEHFESRLAAALGCKVESFVLAARQLRGASESREPLLTASNVVPFARREYDDTELYSKHLDGVITPAACNVLNAMSGSVREMLAWTTEQSCSNTNYRDSFRALLEGPNPLHRYPIVRVFRDKPDYGIAPLPHLIDEWLYETLAAYLYERFDLEARRQLDNVFEEYIGLLFELCSPTRDPWIHESDMLPETNVKVVDWAKPFRDAVILVDAKKAFVDLDRRYRSIGSDWSETYKKSWAKAIVQGTVFWQAVQRREVPALDEHRHKRPLMLVVTLSDTDWRAGQSEVADWIRPYLQGVTPIPYSILSIDRLERVLASWEGADGEWLANCVGNMAELGHIAVAKDLPPPPENPRITQAFADVVRRLSNAVEQERRVDG